MAFVSAELTVQLIINGLLVGGLYALAALGLSLIWGVMRVVNVAHGELIMISAFVSYFLFTLFGIHPLISAIVIIPFGFLLGWLIYTGLIDRVVERADHDLMSLVLMLGVQAIIYGFAAYSWGIDIRGLPILMPTLTLGFLDVPSSRLSTSLIAYVLVVLVLFFLKRTSYGRAVRAVSQNRTGAMLVGINPRKIYAVAFGIGTSLAAISGSLVTLTNPAITPVMGVDFLLRSFAIVVLGGLGNPLGALVGGIILGLAEGISSIYVRLTATVAISFSLLILILIVKPEGIFGSMR